MIRVASYQGVGEVSPQPNDGLQVDEYACQLPPIDPNPELDPQEGAPDVSAAAIPPGSA